MNSGTNYFSLIYIIPLIVAIVGVLYYLNKLPQNIVNPTSHQALTNASYYRFLGYSFIVLIVALISLHTRSMNEFMIMLAFLSFVWFMVGKSWQYTPV